MIPQLYEEHALKQTTIAFLKELQESSYSGEIRPDYASRLITSTDNSVYQVLPQAVLLPRNTQDLMEIFKQAHRDEYKGVHFSPRGGGTGTNGQSLSDGIVIDVSKFMNKILEINIKEGWVKVQPGVVLDQLNASLKAEGVFFAPTLSTSNRATLGGMVNTDACGKGSRIYGKTSNHVLELSLVMTDGSFWQSIPLEAEELKKVQNRSDLIGEVHREIDRVVHTQKELIEKKFPKLSRFLAGYNLAKVYNEGEPFSLNYLLSGSEGTLALVSEMKLKLTPIPQYKKLLVLRYGAFDDALRAAQILVESDPAAIETIDEKILKLAREDAIWDQVGDMLQDQGDQVTKTINLVEFVGEDEKELEQKVEALCQTIRSREGQKREAFGYYIAKNEEEIGSLWNLRKKGVGLLGNTKGNRRPIAFVEDTVVPPEHLADYIQEFRAVLEKHGLEYGMFGHVDVGCLHVRPALDMKDPEDEKLLKIISDEVADLVQKYGGLIWGEHGKGYRSQYMIKFLGQELYQEFRKVKGAFDPHNQLNPGKIATPPSIEEKILPLDQIPFRGQFDRQIPPHVQDRFEVSITCNGNGACFNYNPHEVMCPSSKITRDRIHSPKGRAGMVREWLRQLSHAGYDPTSHTPQEISPLKQILPKSKKSQEYDFSHEVYEAMSGCLSCKACATQCPIKVDIPELKSQFLELYHTRYPRPLKDYFVAGVEDVAKKQSYLPRVMNWLQNRSPSEFFIKNVIGMVDTPQLSSPSLKASLQRRQIPQWNLNHLMNLSEEKKSKSVILVQDTFTSFYEAQLVLDTYDFLTQLGYSPYIAPFHPNGKPAHVKGFLKKFRTIAEVNRNFLNSIARLNIPLVGLEPSIALTYREEYTKTFDKEQLNFKIHLLQEWMTQELNQKKLSPQNQPKSKQYQLMGHCTEKTSAAASQRQWKQIFQAFGHEVKLSSSGCCGMAGTYGHEVDHLEESRGIYEMSWQPQIGKDPEKHKTILATGYSCRSQVKRFEGFIPLHPIQALLQELTFPANV